MCLSFRCLYGSWSPRLIDYTCLCVCRSGVGPTKSTVGWLCQYSCAASNHSSSSNHCLRISHLFLHCHHHGHRSVVCCCLYGNSCLFVFQRCCCCSTLLPSSFSLSPHTFPVFINPSPFDSSQMSPLTHCHVTFMSDLYMSFVFVMWVIFCYCPSIGTWTSPPTVGEKPFVLATVHL